MTLSRITRVLVLGCSLWLVSCAGKPQTPTLPAHEPAHESAHWGYAGAVGPERWASLDPSFAQCGHGQAQTPIDIPASVVPGLAHDLALSYTPSALHLTDNGHTIQANYDPGSYITLGETRYELVQFHFHAHSEHTVAGKPYPLELHLVHKDAQGHLAVLGIFIAEGSANAALAPVFDHIPAAPGAASDDAGVQVDASRFIPTQAGMWRYDGSLTTPPCTEGVKWHVFSQPIEASAAQIAAFTRRYADNARPAQALGARSIEGAHFAYEGEAGPAHWDELAAQWHSCGAGQHQSPIDIPAGTAARNFPQLSLAYKASALNILNNGHTVQVNYDPGSKIKIGTSEYALVQFHLHAHSEHTLAGKPFPLELHLVHRNDAGELAVLGVFIKPGPKNAALAALFDHMPETATAVNTVPGATIDAGALLPARHAMWRYDGSLTTPPCSEGVKWHVFAEPITASPEQIARFTAVFPDDARPTQPLYARHINTAPTTAHAQASHSASSAKTSSATTAMP